MKRFARILVGVFVVAIALQSPEATAQSGSRSRDLDRLIEERNQSKAGKTVSDANVQLGSRGGVSDWEFPQDANRWINSPPLTAESLAGKGVVLVFFEEECPACAAKWPDLVKLSKQYDGRPVVFIAGEFRQRQPNRRVLRPQAAHHLAGDRGLRPILRRGIRPEPDLPRQRHLGPIRHRRRRRPHRQVVRSRRHGRGGARGRLVESRPARPLEAAKRLAVDRARPLRRGRQSGESLRRRIAREREQGVCRTVVDGRRRRHRRRVPRGRGCLQRRTLLGSLQGPSQRFRIATKATSSPPASRTGSKPSWVATT